MRNKRIAAFGAAVLLISACACGRSDVTSDANLSSESGDLKLDIQQIVPDENKEALSLEDTDVSVKGGDGRILYNGRTHTETAYDEKGRAVPGTYFSWTASGFEARFKGSCLYARFAYRELYNENIQYIKIYVDGKMSKKISIYGSGDYCLADHLTDGEHTVRVVKLTEAFGTIGVQYLWTSQDGAFMKAQGRDRRILVMGDSITAGYGNTVTDNLNTGYKTSQQDASQTYEWLIAERFQTQLQVLAESGSGLVKYASGIASTAKTYLESSDNKITGESGDYEMSAYIPDVVILNFGTNDSGAKVDEKEFEAAIIKFTGLVHSYYPKAQVIWAYGAMGNPYDAAFRSAVSAMNAQGIKNVYYKELTRAEDISGGVGVDSHPSYIAHGVMADELTALISKVTGWQMK